MDSPGEAKAMRKETDTTRSARWEHLGHTGRSDPVLDHTRKQGARLDHPGVPWGSKGRAEWDHRSSEPGSGASRAHGGKRPRIRSSKEAGPRNGSLWTGREKQRPRGRRPTTPGAQDRNIQGSRARERIIQCCPEGAGEGDQCRHEPSIGASRAYEEKRRRMGSCMQAGPRTRTSRAAMAKQRPCGRRPPPP